MTGVLIESRHTETETHTGESTWWQMQGQKCCCYKTRNGKVCWQTSEAVVRQTGTLLYVFQKNPSSVDTLILDFWCPKMWDNTFLFFFKWKIKRNLSIRFSCVKNTCNVAGMCFKCQHQELQPINTQKHAIIQWKGLDSAAIVNFSCPEPG